MTRYNPGWCERGHDLSIVGVESGGSCPICHNQRRRERRAIAREVRQMNPVIVDESEPEYRGGRGLPVLGFPHGDWLKDANCASTDPDVFFSDGRLRIEQAKVVCSNCPVIAECLEWALQVEDMEGIVGGTTMEERDEMRRAAA